MSARALIAGLVFSIVNAALFDCSFVAAQQVSFKSDIKIMTSGMSRKKFLKLYPKAKARTYRTQDNEEWFTFNDPSERKNSSAGTIQNMVTFHLKDNKVADWVLNNREEIVREYLGEFCSQAFVGGFPKIHAAIHNVLLKIPMEVFSSITDRSRPVLFTEYHTTGTGRFANSGEIISTPDDVLAFQRGLTIVKLSTELEDADDEQAIEGVVFHELAHRYLEHARKPVRTCEMEREANRLVKEWGFGNEYSKAKVRFGHNEQEGKEPCSDENEKK